MFIKKIPRCGKFITFDVYQKVWKMFLYLGPSSWSYGNWNYLCKQCLSPLTLWVWILLMERCTLCNQHYVIKFVSDLRQVGSFLWVLWFPPRYSWNIFESGVKHHNPNPFIFVHSMFIKKYLDVVSNVYQNVPRCGQQCLSKRT